MPKDWIVRPASPPPPESASWADLLGVSELTVRLLWQRGLMDMRAMDMFLSPGLRHLAQPGQWPGLDEAARLIARSLAAGETLAVWGDYDVDGVTSTALVLDFLRGRGFAPVAHIPDRLEHGYGMNVAGVEMLAAQGVRTLLTVDCGVADHAPVARARELGMTVVVTDHHLPDGELPPAHAVCNPRLGDCPCADLAGVGVIFFVMAAVNRLLDGAPSDMRRFLDLVALGTIADVVPLTGQNRILAKNGMLLVKDAARPGIAALKEVSGFAPQAALTAGHVGFGLAPRINAAGRLGAARDALDLLLAPDLDTARPLAARLDTMNTERRREEETIQAEALEQAEAMGDRPGFVLYAPHWHQGIIGIVASRVVDIHYRPTLLVCDDGDALKGSGRSISEVDLHAALDACAPLLIGFGGHRQAAGLRVAPANLDALRDAFDAAIAGQIGPTPLPPRLKVDMALGFGQVDYPLLKELELLQPFGAGNPEPLFASPPVEVLGIRFFGKDHAALDLRDQDAGVTLRAKAWRMAKTLPDALRGKRLKVAFTPKLDQYNGVSTIDLNVKDWLLLHGAQ
ncbi:MAG: single-stranded-DNA-specific exonuclease RecJ [Desulfovibrionaceae bacterium]